METPQKDPFLITGQGMLDGYGSYCYLNLFLHYHQRMPNIIIESKIDVIQLKSWLEEHQAKKPLERLSISRKLRETGQVEEDDIFYHLPEGILLNLDTNRSRVRLLYSGDKDIFIDHLHRTICRFKKDQTPAKVYLHLLQKSHGGFEIEAMEIKKPEWSIDDNYNEDFLPVHEVIVQRLQQKQDKGIVLLHGAPGTGKTSYIRHLIGTVDKKFIFLPPAMAGALTDPGLISILTENPNSIFVIEDAENILVGRDSNRNSPVSTLLNISDGLLADCLNIQIICSFNTDLSKVDNALLRKGRLIAKYDFQALSPAKAQQLSDKLGFQTNIEGPMRLNEIYHQQELSISAEEKKKAIGF